jgi:tight adherence protein F
MMNLKKSLFLKEEEGALSVEFAAVFFGFILIIFLVYDVYTTIALQNKLDRSTYSASTIFRQRPLFFSGEKYIEQIDQLQVNQLQNLLISMMDEEQIQLRVDLLTVKSNESMPNDIVSAHKTVTTVCSSSGCNSAYFSKLPDLSSYHNLTVYSKLNRWIPLYRVSACMPNSGSLYTRMSNSINNINELCTSSIVISRCKGNCSY